MRQAPGDITLELKCGIAWSAYLTSIPAPGPAKRISLQQEQGLFSFQLDPPSGLAIMSRSELAALHAAMGELLEFYRGEML